MINFIGFIKPYMLTELQINKLLEKEVNFKTSRSGGKGGQNVNKVESKVEIEFDVIASKILSLSQKHLILKKHKDLLNQGTIKLLGNRYRSQLDNKTEAKNKLIRLLNKLLKPEKKRIATKPGKKAKEKKLLDKKMLKDKKLGRKKVLINR